MGTVVHQRLQALQEGALRNRSADVAALARLRRAVGKPVGSIGDVLQHTTHEHFAGPDAGDEATPAERAAHIAMTLYAVHQQSQNQRMHQRGWGIGRAMRALHPEEPAAPNAVLHRFQRLGTSDSLDELTHHARGVVQLLRAAQIPLDYALLTDELLTWQRPGGAARVRLRWGREFYRTTPR
ncbi:type I-E CRISPR-associated protein Cse2/CasB [Allokutzneria albata]|uniref:CRISPR-associated protein, Cse2 family n=1 Tax=Allokutzneria albata TaxID=211114 RepID=A0A1G9WEY3_ALLAB|nr:type I-E CRISPR-associated protein Cse2/CasB [Allokutzneria albata]SDM82771.1 CRISPR-associated protein, Cse2 family [Allokutzneria albata]